MAFKENDFVPIGNFNIMISRDAMINILTQHQVMSRSLTDSQEMCTKLLFENRELRDRVEELEEKEALRAVERFRETH